MFLLLSCLQDFLFISTLQHFNYMFRCDLSFLLFILSRTSWTSLICGLLSFSICVIIHHYLFKYFSAVFLLSSFYVKTLDIVPWLLDALSYSVFLLLFLFLFFLCFSLDNFHWTIFKLNYSFLGYTWLTDEPTEDILHIWYYPFHC